MNNEYERGLNNPSVFLTKNSSPYTGEPFLCNLANLYL